MFDKIRKFVKSFCRRIRKSVVNTIAKIKRVVKNACQRISSSPALAFAVSATLACAATAAAAATGSVKVVKGVATTGLMFVSGFTCMAWRKKKMNADYNELKTVCEAYCAANEQ